MKTCGRLLIVVLFASCIHNHSRGKTAHSGGDSDLLQIGNPYQPMDQSPMDMVYYPVDYPQQKLARRVYKIPDARVIFSRPHKNGRSLFGAAPQELVPYGKPWRLGANEATEIEFFRNVMINRHNVPAGKYVLYAIPFADHWTIVVNKNIFSWGLDIDSSKDFVKTDVPVQTQSPPIEDFTMKFNDEPYGADLLVAWDSVKVNLPIEFSH